MGLHHKKPLGWKVRMEKAKQWAVAEKGRPLQLVLGSLSALILVVLGAMWLLSSLG